MASEVYKTVLDFVRILGLFSDFKTEDHSVSEIAKALKLDPSKVSRMMSMLVKEGVFDRNEESGRFRARDHFFSN